MRAEVMILANPFDPLARQVAVLRRPLRVRRLMPQDRPAVAILNGRPLLRAGWRRRLRPGDRLVIAHLPRGGGGQGGGGSNPLRLILSLALMAFAPWAAAGLLGTTPALVGSTLIGKATTLGIYMLGSALINAILPPPKPAQIPNPSPTYSLQGQGNAARLEQAIPVQYGRVLSYPDYAAQPYFEYSGNEQFLYNLLCLGAGEFEIEELRIEDTPIGSFDEVEVEIVNPGEQVTLFPTAVVTSVEVSGQELAGRAFGTWTKSGTIVTLTEADHLRAAGQGVNLDLYVEAPFTWSGTVLTVTEAGHDRSIGDTVWLSFPAGQRPYTVATVASTAAGSWTITTPDSGSASGTLEVRSPAHPSGGWPIASILDAETWTVDLGVAGSAAGAAVIGSMVGGVSGFVASGPETVAERLGLDLIMPRGLYKSGSKGLETIGLTVRFEAQRIDDIGQPVGAWFELGRETVTDRTNTPQRRSFLYTLETPGRYRVRVWRADPKSDEVNDGHEGLLGGLRAYLTEPEDFGPVTLIAVRMRASNNLSAQSSRKVAVLATRKVPVWTVGELVGLYWLAAELDFWGDDPDPHWRA